MVCRFERAQYKELREEWEANPNGSHKSPCDTYGAEHFARLLGEYLLLYMYIYKFYVSVPGLTSAAVSLPELIAQTNMDQQSVNRLREELSKLTNWLGRRAKDYFVSEYETPSQEYIEKARSV